MKVKVLSASTNHFKLLALEDGEIRDYSLPKEAYLVVNKGDIFEINRDEISSDQFEIVNE